MKNVLITFVMAFSTCAIAQVGINTLEPKVTLDLEALPENTEIKDGILIPKLKGDDLKAKDALYDTNENGTLVYITEKPTSTTDKTANILEEGFYYYDANKKLWTSFKASNNWYKNKTQTSANLNTDDIYQTGNVSIGTQYGQSVFHVDAGKNNTSDSASTTEMLDDFLVHPTGRVYIGAKPNDLLLLAGVEDKIKVASNLDLDVDYDLATTTNSQCIVHRNIMSSGTMDNRGPRRNLTSIASFEGHTYVTPTLENKFSWYQQRASIVLRTGRSLDNGGEIWFGTAGTTTYSQANPKQAWYRAVMDEKGYWAYGADPNGEGYSAPTERLDVLVGGLRLRQLNTAAYTASSANRIVVVDANGVIKSIDKSALFPNNSARNNNQNSIKSTVSKINNNQSLNTETTLVDANNSEIVLSIDNTQEIDGNKLTIKKIDSTNNIVTIKSNKKIDNLNEYVLNKSQEGIVIQYYQGQWYVISKI